MGTELAGYRIERVLGRGGMSVVYLAEHLRLKRRVALKVLAPELAQDPRFRDRFVRESQIAASLEDPNVIPIYEAGEYGDVLFIAMRYVEGTDLKSLLATEGPLPAGRVAAIVSQVASALDAAHDRGLVHRDVKPANILILPARDASRPEHVFLSDFGLTKRAASDSGITGTGQFVGTIDYAAPEQFEGKPLDARTDVYSLGCVLYESLTGSAPFPKEQDVARMHAHLHQAPPKVSSLRTDMPSAVDAVVAKAMAKRPDHRYARAGDVATAATNALGAVGWDGPPPRRPRLGALVAAVAAAVAAAAVAIVLLTRGGGTTRTPASSGAPSAMSRNVPAVPGSSLVRVDPSSGKVKAIVQDIPGLTYPPFISKPKVAVGEGAVWVYTQEGNPPVSGQPVIIHVDGGSGRVTRTILVREAFGAGHSIIVSSRTVWFTGEEPQAVSRINPATDARLRPVSVTGSVTDLALGAGALWAGSTDGTLTRFNPVTGHLIDRISLGATPDALAFGAGSLWALDKLGNQVIRLDGRSGELLRRISVNGSLADIVAGDEGVWLLDTVAGTVTPIDPETNTPGAPLPVGPRASDIAVGVGFVWVTDESDGTLYRVDPAVREVTPFDLGTSLAAVAVDPRAGRVWVAVYEV